MAIPLKLRKSDVKKIAKNMSKAGGKKTHEYGNPDAEAKRRKEVKPLKVTIRVRKVITYVVEDFLDHATGSCYGPVAETKSKTNAMRIAKVWKRGYEKENIKEVLLVDLTKE